MNVKKKIVYKKPFETIERYEECTWLGNDKPFFENENTAVFWDRYPVTRGHLLFIPKNKTPEYVGEAYQLAYYCGNEWIKEGKMDGFNVGMNIGECAGQTIMWPHIHLIPRRNGDSKEIGGMRHAHPGGDHYKYY